MKNFESGLKKLNDNQVKFISEKGLYEDDLYDLGRSMYMIAYKSDVKLLGNGKVQVSYAQEDTDSFLEKLNKILEELEIKNSKEDVGQLFDIVCNIYQSTAMTQEKEERGSFIRTRYGTGVVGRFVTANLNEVPEEYLEQIKEDVLKS